VAGNGTSNGKDGLTHQKTFTSVGELVNCLATSCLNSWGSNIVKAGDNAFKLSQTIRNNSAKFRAMRNFTYIPFDTHSVQHWKEKGVTSSEGREASNWHYIEDAIGNQPLVSRKSNIPNILRRARPNPGRVRWESLYNGLSKKIIDEGKWPEI
jgi:hypothetical protein